GSRDEAAAALSQALALRQTLARAHPGDDRHREAMALIHLERGLAWQALGRASDAEREFARAIEIDEGLAAARPDALEIHGRLGDSLNALGAVQFDTSRLAEAEASYLRAREALARFAAARPDDVALHNRIASLDNNLGR